MAKNKRIKSPKINVSKQPKIEQNPDGWYDKHPSWRFSKMDNEHNKWSPCDNKLIENHLLQMCNYEKNTWRKLLNDNSHANHLVDVQNLSKEAQDRLKKLEILTDSLIQLRVGGTKRIFGLIEDGVMSILWYDLNHEVYPVEKKHT